MIGPVAWYMASRGEPAVLDVVVAGDPVGKGRPIFAKRGKFVTTRTPDKTVAWERRAEVIALEAWGERPPLPREGVEIVVLVEAVHDRPKDLLPKPVKPKARKPAAEIPRGRIPCRKKPDLDNVVKCVLDALVLARVLEDDVSVSSVAAEKSYRSLDEGPSVRIRVFAMGVPS